VPYNGFGKINKKQINAKIYQPLGGDDFIAIAGHFNSNRNHVFGSVPLRIDASPSRTVGTSNAGRFTLTRVERDYTINFPCTTTMPRPGLPDLANSCGTDFDRRYNPSDTGNVRISSRFTLAEGLVLTVDPSFQYVKAAGGTSAITAREGLRDIDPTSGTNNVAGFLGGNPYFGRDINGDGDALDQVTIWAPSMTQTRRYGLITGLRWEMNDNHTFRVGYTLDRARHRQTGEVALVWGNGEPYNVFPMDDLQKDVNGNVLQKRDRLSYATLHQVFGEYRGQFMDNRLEITAGVRAPFFKRDLTNYCFASSASGFVECFGQSATLNTAAQALNPYSSSVNATTGTVSVTGWAPPQNRVYKYNRILPNAGFVFDVADNLSLFGNFSQGLTVPGTDNLYNAFYFPVNTARAQPKPETTDNFDLGVRYRSGTVQAQLSGFYNQFHNRLASAYDPDIGQTVYRNLGNVKKYGIDGSISYSPIPQIALYVFGSVIKSKIRDNLAVGENLDGTPILALTAGKREAGAPKYTFGFTARGTVGPVDLGITAKRTGERYVLDTNEATYTGTFIAPGAKACSGTTTITCVTPNPATAPSRTAIFGETAPAYWLVNLDARVNLKFLGLNDKTFFQANVYNLFDKLYVGGFGGNLNQSQTFVSGTGVSTYGNPGFVQIGAPRTISGTLVFAF
ncbi:MAG: TonB-dependent receptor domain-containing protein, partial [Novosphingobium sp.]